MQVISEYFHYNIRSIVICRYIGELEYVVNKIASSLVICDIDKLGFVVVDGILRKINTRLIITV